MYQTGDIKSLYDFINNKKEDSVIKGELKEIFNYYSYKFDDTPPSHVKFSDHYINLCYKKKNMIKKNNSNKNKINKNSSKKIVKNKKNSSKIDDYE